MAEALYPNKKIGAIGNYIDAVAKTEGANRKREAIRRSGIFQHNKKISHAPSFEGRPIRMDQANASVILSLRFERFKTCVEKLRVICAPAGCGYQVEKIQCVDMFYWTGAVESVVCLSRQKPDGVICVGLDLDEREVTPVEAKIT